MNEYTIEIQETLSCSVKVEAKNKELAIAKAMIDYYECKYALDNQDLRNVKFNIKETEE